MTNAKNLNKNIGYYYLATPYSKWPQGLEDANTEAQKLAARLLELRLPIYCPIAHTHGIATFVTGVDKRDHDFWLSADKPLVLAARGLLVANMEGWPDSRGVMQEIAWSQETYKPIWMLDPETLDVYPFGG
jgi:hypothetical protein